MSDRSIIETPCRNSCLYNAGLGHCETCGRTLEDLEIWTHTTRGDRRSRARQAKERIRKMNELKAYAVEAYEKKQYDYI